jgi:hypothetical protein
MGAACWQICACRGGKVRVCTNFRHPRAACCSTLRACTLRVAIGRVEDISLCLALPGPHNLWAPSGSKMPIKARSVSFSKLFCEPPPARRLSSPGRPRGHVLPLCAGFPVRALAKQQHQSCYFQRDRLLLPLYIITNSIYENACSVVARRVCRATKSGNLRTKPGGM